MESRNVLFTTLKPFAVAVSEAARTLTTPQKDIDRLRDSLEALNSTVKDVAARPGFDAKLADYVFFPVAQVLKHSQLISLRCLEVSLSIVAVLIRDGWSASIELALAQQLFILCTLLINEDTTAKVINHTSDELQINALDSLRDLLLHFGRDPTAKAALTTDINIPQLGSALSGILALLRTAPAGEVQSRAAAALDAFVSAGWSASILWSFLPGIVSTLARVLTPSTQQRRSPAILVDCIAILGHILQDTFGKNNDLGIDHAQAAIKVQAALKSISKLGTHDKSTVIDALVKLMIHILDKCSTRLSNCLNLALEVLVTVSNDPDLYTLSVLISQHEDLRNLLQSILHDWAVSLVRVMQSADPVEKLKRIKQLQTAYTVLRDANLDMTTTNELLGQCMADGIAVSLYESDRNSQQSPSTHNSMMGLLSFGKELGSIRQHDSRAIIRESSLTTSLNTFITTIMQDDGSDHNFLAALTRAEAHSSGNSKVAHLWLILATIRVTMDRNADLDQYMLTSGTQLLPQHTSDALEVVYASALDVLSAPSEITHDNRLQSLALQALALRARSSGREFRIELIDALYPVLNVLANPTGQLRDDSMATLNAITQACEYNSIRELLIDNVDYLTNAVALKLNAFDVSPQAPRILLMMVRLAGPSLLPYLEDSVDSIFAALEDFNGYPLLVELLFQTLSAIAEEGANARQLTDSSIELIGSSLPTTTVSWQPISIEDLAERLTEHEQTRSGSTEETIDSEAAPHRPWKQESDENDQPIAEVEDPGPPAPKTYALLLKITDLTQHFLPSVSPTLRLSLLSLICNTVPAIAKHENSFLPLINTLWPEIVSRLDEDEAAVRMVAMNTISAICTHAGDFMRSRIIELWPFIRQIHNDIIRQAVPAADVNTKTALSCNAKAELLLHRMIRNPAAYSDTSLRKLWESFLALLVAITQHVSISAELFDEALEMVTPELDDVKIEAVFAAHNSDAVWLCRMKAGYLHKASDDDSVQV